MTTFLNEVLASTLSASTSSQDVVLLTVAHGTVRTRGLWLHQEMTRTFEQGDVTLLDAVASIQIPAEAAPGTQQDDVAFVGGRLWHVRVPLDDGAGNLKLQLQRAQPASKGAVAGMAVTMHVVGDVEEDGPLVVLAPAGILRPGDEVRVRGETYVAGVPAPWEGGYAVTVVTPKA